MRTKALPWVLIAVALVLIALLARRNDDTGEPLDPESTGPLGARGLVLLLEEMGADVDISPSVRGDVAVLLVDELGDTQEDEIRAWVRGGGTLVVADPLSSFAPALARSGGGLFDTDSGNDGETLRPGCDLPALARVGEISGTRAAMFRVKPGAVGCFGAGAGEGNRDSEGSPDSAYLVARAEGSGTVVALGGGGPFVNDRLDDVDNAVLAVSLMSPRSGTSVTVLQRGAAGSGNESLTDLVPTSVRAGLWQLAVAFGALVLWRGRRLGKPVVETQPVAIPGSELVVATGHLLEQAGRRDAAADMLRLQLRRDLVARFGLPADAPAEQVRQLLVQRGVPAASVDIALAQRAVADDRELIVLAAAIDSLRREVMHA